MARSYVVSATAALCLVASACSGESPQGEGEGQMALPSLPFVAFAPTLDGEEPERTRAWPDHIRTTYGSRGSLTQAQAPSGDLCVALETYRLADDECEVTDGVAHTSMEEMGGVGLVRDGTLLYWSSLVTEADQGLLTRAEAAIREAPVAEGGDLGDVTIKTSPPTPEAAPSEEPVDDPIRPADFVVTAAMGTVRHLAGNIGPRQGTSRAFHRAARWVERTFDGLGYEVTVQRFRAPAGVSWGVPIPAGRSVNVIATPPGFDRTQPHLIVGAHLDTVPQAPGAEDNASGVAVLLEVATAASVRRTRLPVVFVAFGAEEPRGSPEDHHYGSRHFVSEMGSAQRKALRGMVSLDRVGVGTVVPVGSADAGVGVQRQLLAAARRAGIDAVADPGQRSSDHWSFVREGLPGARLGSTPYAGYHSAGDVPSVVSRDQLERVGGVLISWLQPRD